MWPSALNVDHTRKVAKPRTCYIVLEFQANLENFNRIATVQSNNEKAELWVSSHREKDLIYRIVKESVL